MDTLWPTLLGVVLLFVGVGYLWAHHCAVKAMRQSGERADKISQEIEDSWTGMKKP